MDSAKTPNQDAKPDSPPRPSNGIRWWPAIVILTLATLAIIWIRTIEETHAQARNLQTMVVGLVATLLLLIWSLSFARLQWRVRWLVLALFVATVAGVTLSVNIRGVTGNLIPILEWRWQKGHRPELPAATPPIARSSPPLPPTVLAGSYPQFLGPERNATLPGPRLTRDWSARPPQEIWRQPIGPAWSGFAVARGLAITQEQRGPQELVTCYEALAGKVLWTHSDTARYCTTIAGEGPRATPTMDGDRVYTLGATGILNCLEAPTGRLIWSRNILQENRGRVPGWGLSGSPLLVDDRVVVSAGGRDERSLVAYAKHDGRRLWTGGSDAASYSSPVLCSMAGVQQILMFNASLIAAHDPGSGKLLWQYPWSAAQAHVAVPVRLPGDRVLVSSGYGVGSEALQIQSDAGGHWTASRVWKSARLKAKFTNAVCHQGFIYGLDDGIMVCLDAATGGQKWKAGRYGHGQVILVGELLLVTAENGEIVLLEPVPQALRELARFKVFKTKTWNPPALVGEFLFVRNDLEAACFRLPVEDKR